MNSTNVRTAVRTAVTRVRRAIRYEVHAFWRSRPIRRGTVLYESFSGNGMLDNPEAIFRKLLDSPDLAGLQHIWALANPRRHRCTIREFAGRRTVRFVKYGSAAYYRALATSQYLVNNATFPQDFGKRDGQTYLNTWHGTPLKKMGFDMPNGAVESANTVRNFLAADYLLSTGAFMTQQMYESSYKLSGIFRGEILEVGYPRIDRQFLEEPDQADARSRLEAAGLPIGDRKIILYAPTWKGSTFSRPIDDIDSLLAHVAVLESQLDPAKYCVLLKTHQILHEVAAARPELSRMLVPNDLPTNVILGVTDLLVTDYSSIFFDYLATGRPIVFFAPDLEDYSSNRRLYFPPAELPGPLCRTGEELADAIRTLLADGIPAAVAARYREARRAHCASEDGQASERVIDIVFRGRREGYRIRSDFADDRTSILIYLGGMKSNGITSSALNLLTRIDHSRFDVTVFSAPSDKHGSIPPAVRQIIRVGGMNGSKLVQVLRRIDLLRGTMAHYRSHPSQARLWQDEWRRCFGPSQFDHVIDFSGYSPFWACLLQQSPEPAVRSIWLHNDLAADANRVVEGRRPFRRGLTAMLALYEGFDALVSVSPALAEVNRRNLATPGTADKFTSAANIIDGDTVRQRARIDLRQSVRAEDGSIPSWAGAFNGDPGRITTFVTVGRLSEEKNHARLIEAFARVHAVNRATRLVIVGGGPLHGSLTALVQRLHLDQAVILTGELANPYPLMAASDCFVLSSNYEGQPMVILEALILGLPVVTVTFDSVADAVPAGTGLVVPQSVEGLRDGMTAYLEGRIPREPFDDDAYNAQALQDFYTAIGVRDIAEDAIGSPVPGNSSGKVSG